MKKVCSAALALVMVLVLAFGLCACGDNNQTAAVSSEVPQVKDKDLIVGKWQAELDLSSAVTAGMTEGENAELAGYFDIKDFVVTMFYEYKDDGTYTANVEEASLATAMDNMWKSIEAGMAKYLNDMLAGQGMTIDDYFAATGTTMDDLMSEMKSQIDGETLTSAFCGEGKWKIRKSKLYESNSLEEDVDTSKYTTYELTENKLVLKKVNYDDNELELSTTEREILKLYPITFTRVK